jgi:hypothetical protein
MKAKMQHGVDLVQTQSGLPANLPTGRPGPDVLCLESIGLKGRIEAPVDFHWKQAAWSG